MNRYILSPAARDDLRRLRDYLNQQAGHRVARRVLERFVRALSRLNEMPQLGHRREDLTDQPVRFYRVYRYLIVYRADRAPMEVVRVLHSARDVRRILKAQEPKPSEDEADL